MCSIVTVSASNGGAQSATVFVVGGVIAAAASFATDIGPVLQGVVLLVLAVVVAFFGALLASARWQLRQQGPCLTVHERGVTTNLPGASEIPAASIAKIVVKSSQGVPLLRVMRGGPFSVIATRLSAARRHFVRASELLGYGILSVAATQIEEPFDELVAAVDALHPVEQVS